MSHSLCLQPWVNITGTSQTITQNDAEWADLAGYAAAAIYVELGFVSPQGASLTLLNFETAPSKDPNLFQLYGGMQFSAAPAPTLGVQPILLPTTWATTSVPLARFFRWSLVFGTTATSIHFRIWLNLMQAGW